MAQAQAQRIGVLGVGRMGGAVARRLVSAGLDVTVFDTDAVRAASTGTAVAASARELAVGSDVLLTVLPGIPEIAHAMIGAGRLVDAVPVGALWVDLTSNDPRVAREVAEALAARGIDAVGAPMAGGVAAAEGGAIRFFAGGRAAAIDRARPVLEPLGSVEVIGSDIGAGYTAKLLANLLWFGQVVAVTEALLLGQSLGLEPGPLRSQLATSAGGSVFIDEYLDRLLEGDYLESFGLDRCVEELETLVSLARDGAVPFELSATVSRLHREALELFGAVDGELLAAKLLEHRAGRTLRR
jgi:3-hydroxyisobutyrate dehydrogenase-like beta-hydroxyacid dehydrogenase